MVAGRRSASRRPYSTVLLDPFLQEIGGLASERRRVAVECRQSGFVCLLIGDRDRTGRSHEVAQL
jgi:hypothetical protein